LDYLFENTMDVDIEMEEGDACKIKVDSYLKPAHIEIQVSEDDSFAVLARKNI